MNIRSGICNIMAGHVKKPITLLNVDLKEISKDDLGRIVRLLFSNVFKSILVFSFIRGVAVRQRIGRIYELRQMQRIGRIYELKLRRKNGGKGKAEA